MKKISATILFFLVTLLFSQSLNDKVIVDWSTEPRLKKTHETIILTQAKALTAPVSIVGIGGCGVANGKTYNGMLENPALLIHERKELFSISARAEATQSTFRTLSFISSNENTLLNGTAVDSLSDAIYMYTDGDGAEDRIAAVRKVNNFLGEIDEFTERIIGYPDPVMYGISLLPKISFQWKRFGFSIVAEGRGFLMGTPGDILNGIGGTTIPVDSNGFITAEGMDAMTRFGLNLVDKNGEVKPSALPTLYILGFADISTVAGYAHPIGERFSVGGNLNFITRVFSATVLSAHNYSHVMRTAGEELTSVKSNHFVTLDLGGLYRDSERKLDIGLSLQNLIPLLKIDDQIRVFSSSDSVTYRIDSTGDVQIGFYDAEADSVIEDESGDTLVDYSTTQVETTVPLRVELPFIATIGCNWEVTSFLSVAAEWKDIFANDKGGYKYYGDRFSLGTELDFRDLLFLRAGLATHRPTVGAGVHVDIFEKVFMGLDMAYAYDNFGREMGIFAEFQVALRI